MGFFSGIWKGIKKSVIDPIAKGIKSAARKVGKFMDKIGIVGQIGLMFILPGIGGLLSQGVGALAASANPLLAGLGNVLSTVGKFASTAGNAFKTVTNGITSFVKNMGEGFINQAATALGKDSLVFQAGPGTVTEGFGKWMQGVAEEARNITSPFSKVSGAVSGEVQTAYDKTFADPSETLTGTLRQSEAPSGPTFDSIFGEQSLDIPDLNVLKNDQPFGVDLDSTAITNVVDAESGGMKQFLSDTASYAFDTIKDVPQNIIDLGAETVTQGVVTRGAQSLGLAPTPADIVTNVTNVPQFNSAPVMVAYEQNGLNYGALPDNRLQFYATQNASVGDFGFNSFSQFARMRTI